MEGTSYNEEELTFWDKFKKMFMSPISKEPKNISANDAFLKTKYGKVESKEERYKNLISAINEEISQKCNMGEYCCIAKVPSDLEEEYLEKLTSEYKDKGFDVIDMREFIKRLNKTILFISWYNGND